MSSESLVYRHIWIYRFIMNILYLGKYRQRFDSVMDYIKDQPPNTKILELCFGDTYIAQYCKNAGYQWQGIDLNPRFIENAQKCGYNASLGDLAAMKTLPPANICVMIGSLYHFHPETCLILQKMIDVSKTIIISEPVSNLSSKKGIIGYLARRSANAGKGNEVFRYNESSLMSIIGECGSILGYQVVSTKYCGKDLILKLSKKDGGN